jgi:Cys-tRNA(Pro)/Cys-tRNA(Cys) deacylase
MTPAINVLKKAGVPYKMHEYDHDPSAESYGLEAALKLGVPEERVFKTLVVGLDGGPLAVGILPVSSKLNMKLFAKAAGAKKAAMASKPDVQRATGYVLGGVSPLGQKRRLRTFIDASAAAHSTIIVSAGRRGLDVELDPQDLKTLTNGTFADLCGGSAGGGR